MKTFGEADIAYIEAMFRDTVRELRAVHAICGDGVIGEDDGHARFRKESDPEVRITSPAGTIRLGHVFTFDTQKLQWIESPSGFLAQYILDLKKKGIK